MSASNLQQTLKKPLHHGPPARGDHKGQFERPTAFHMGTASRPSMKTLDKKISVSSDQLDTLTSDQRQDKFAQLKSGFPIRPRASYRLPTRDVCLFVFVLEAPVPVLGLRGGFKLYISSPSLLLITPELVRFLGAPARPRGW